MGQLYYLVRHSGKIVERGEKNIIAEEWGAVLWNAVLCTSKGGWLFFLGLMVFLGWVDDVPWGSGWSSLGE